MLKFKKIKHHSYTNFNKGDLLTNSPHFPLELVQNIWTGGGQIDMWGFPDKAAAVVNVQLTISTDGLYLEHKGL